MKYILLLFLLFGLLQCKTQKTAITNNVKMIKGIAMDKTGPLPGAYLNIKGTERKASTDINGNFEIEVKEGEILIVGFVGLGSIEVLIDSKDFYEVIVPQWMPPMNRKMIRWQRKYAREHHGELPEF